MEKKGLSGKDLKILASASMLADHICAVFFSSSRIAGFIRGTFGRLAFPIFAFLLIEGFLHSKSRTRMAVRLLIFCLASEVFFDLTFYGCIPYPFYQNVFLTLLIGFIMLSLMEKIKAAVMIKYEACPKNRLFLSYFISQAAAAVLFGLAAAFLKTDYGFWGIAAIAVFYFMKDLPPRYSSAVSVLILNLPSFGMAGAFLSVIPLDNYNYSRGNITKTGKYAFYIFYPAHLLLLYVIKLLL